MLAIRSLIAVENICVETQAIRSPSSITTAFSSGALPSRRRQAASLARVLPPNLDMLEPFGMANAAKSESVRDKSACCLQTPLFS
jgi:hypothetical protein